MSIDKLKELTDILIEQRLASEAVAESATDGYWDWHIQEDYEYMSPKFWEIMGYDPKTKKYHPSEWQSLIHPDDLPIAIQNFNRHVESKGEHKYTQIVRYKHFQGHWIDILCRGEVIKWNGDEPERMVGIHIYLNPSWVENNARSK